MPAAVATRRSQRTRSGTSSDTEDQQHVDGASVDSPLSAKRQHRLRALKPSTGTQQDDKHSNGSRDSDSTDTDDASSEVTSGESDHSDVENSPVKRPRSRQKKDTVAPRRSNLTAKTAKGHGGELEGSLFEALCTSGVSVESLVKDWMSTYRQDHAAATVELLQLLVRASGCPAELSAGELEGGADEMPGLVEDLQEYLEQKMAVDYPLKSTAKDMKKFRKHFVDFWYRWMVNTQYLLLFASAEEQQTTAENRRKSKSQAPSHSSVFESGKEIMELILAFAVAMSSSSYRPFRLTATTAILATMDSISEICQSLSKELVTLQRLQKKQGGNRNRDDQVTLHARKVEAENYLMQLFNSIYLNRARDVDAEVRKECTAHLGVWIYNYPEYFLEPAYLRYLGWYLSDKDAGVRAAAVHSIAKLLSQSDLIGGMRQFSERIRSRVVEMALGEIDLSVRRDVITGIIAPFHRCEILEDTDKTSLLRLLLVGDAEEPKLESIRKVSAPVLLSMFIEDHMVPDMEEAQSSADASDEEFQQFVALKSLVKWFGSTLQSSRGAYDGKDRNADQDDEEADNATNPALCMSANEFRESIETAFEAFHAAVLETDRIRDRNVEKQVTFLQKVMQDYELILRFLQTDAEEDSPYRLDEFDEAILVNVLLCSVRYQLAVRYQAHGHERFEEVPPFPAANDDKPTVKPKANDDLERKRTNFVRTMQQHLDPFLMKFGVPETLSGGIPVQISVSKVLCAVELTFWTLVGIPASAFGPMFLSSKVWLDLRKISDYEELVKVVVEQMFLKHTDAKILSTLGRLLFGCWRSAYEDGPLGLLEGTNTLRYVTEKIGAGFEKLVIDSIGIWCDRLCGLDFDGDELNEEDQMSFGILLRRLEALVANRCPESEDLTSRILTVASKILPLVGVSLKEESRWVQGGSGSDEDPMDDDELDANGEVAGEANTFAQIVATMFRCSFYLLVWRFASLESRSDAFLLKDLNRFLGLSSDIMRAAKRQLLDICMQATDDAKDIVRASAALGDVVNADATYLSLFGDESARGQAVSSDVEIAALTEEIALRLFHCNKLLSEFIMGMHVQSGGSGLLSMLADLMALVPLQADADEGNVECRQQCVNRLTQHAADLVGIACERVFSNLLANAKTGTVYSSTGSASKKVAELHNDEDEEGEARMEHWRNTYLTIRSLLGSVTEHSAVVHVKRAVTVAEKNVILGALNAATMAHVRLSWMAFETDTIREGSLHGIAHLLSWHGRWNGFMDEVVRCVAEQLCAFVHDRVVGDSSGGRSLGLVKRQVSSLLVAALKESMLASAYIGDFHKNVDGDMTVSRLDLDGNLVKLLTSVFRVKKSAAATPSETRLREFTSELFSAVEDGLLRQGLARAMVKSTTMTVPHVAGAKSRAVVEEMLARGFGLLTALNGTVGGFGTDMLLPKEAAQLYPSVKRLMEVEKKDALRLACGRGLESGASVVQAPFQRYLKSLAGIAKKGAIIVDAAPTSVFIGSSSMAGTRKGVVKQKKKPAVAGLRMEEASASGSEVEEEEENANAFVATSSRATRAIKRATTMDHGDAVDGEESDGSAESPKLKRIRRA